MNFLMNFSFQVNKFLYSTRGLKILRIFAWSGIIATFLGAMVSFGLHYYSLLMSYGRGIVVLSYAPYLLFGTVTAIWKLLRGKNEQATLAIIVGTLPSALLTEYGITALLFFAMASTIYFIEKKHRQNVVSIVAKFSKMYSPFYSKRLENKNKYKEYQASYRLLELIDVQNFKLVKNIDVTVKNLATGIPDRQLHRTFKINGLWGKTTICDELYIAPQKRGLLPKRRII